VHVCRERLGYECGGREVCTYVFMFVELWRERDVHVEGQMGLCE